MFKNISKEAIESISTNTKFAISGQLVALLGIIFILKDIVDANVIFVGLGVHLLLIISRGFIRRYFSNNLKVFFNLYFISTFLSGVAWGAVLFFIQNATVEYHILVFAIYIGLISVALFTLGEVFTLYLSYALPILGISIVWFFLHGENDIYKIVSFLVFFAAFYYISAAKKYANSFNEIVSQKQKNEKLLKELEEKSELFELLFEHSVIGALIIEDGKIAQCNQKSVEMVGCASKEELYNMRPADISPQYQADGRLSSEKATEMMQIALDKGSNIFEWLHKKQNGKIFLAEINLTSLMLNGKKVLYTSWQDITQEKNYENNLKHLAYHDNLTGLPNRMLFNDRLEQAILKSNRSSTQLAVFFIDLDKFKPINDSLGHEVGDKVLIKVTGLLRKELRREDTLARIGGDEFTIIMENFSDIKYIVMVAKKLLQALRSPVKVDSHNLDLSLSIGVSIYPQDAQDSKTLLKLADAAMYKAKEGGRDTYRFYKEDALG